MFSNNAIPGSNKERSNHQRVFITSITRDRYCEVELSMRNNNGRAAILNTAVRSFREKMYESRVVVKLHLLRIVIHFTIYRTSVSYWFVFNSDV